MIFLNPFVLFGLAAAAIPVILHLLNLRKLRTIEFSTLSFLKELQQTKIRRLKLRQIILLIVRTLLVIFIVLAFARPALRGTILGSIGTHAHSTILFILDDSFSMMARDEHGELFKQATESMGKLLDLVKEGDEVFLIKLSDVPQATVDPATHDVTALRTIVNEAQVSSVRRSMDGALSLAVKLLQRSVNANKEVYVISDMQQTLFKKALMQQQEQGIGLFDLQTNMFIIPLGSKDEANVAIDSMEVTTTILEKDKPASVYIAVRNYSRFPLNNYVVSAYLDGTRAAQGNVSVEPWGTASVVLNVTPKRSGFLKGYVELENDAIEIDNRRYFTIVIPERINVAMVSDAESDNTFTLHALHASTSDETHSVLNVQQITMQKFPLLDLKRIDVLVFTNIKSFSASDIDRVKSFVGRGGGLLLFPGPNIQIEDYNTSLLPSLNIPTIQSITGTANQATSLSFQNVDFNHPLFTTVFEKHLQQKKHEPDGFESPNIMRSLKRQAGKEGRTIIALSDGSAFLSEHRVGNGKVLFFSVAPLLTWSDFPLKGIFAPLIFRSTMYVSPREENGMTATTGEEPTISVRSESSSNVASTEAGNHYKMITPDGIEELVQPSSTPSRLSGFGTALTFAPKRLNLPGFYELRNGSTTLALLAVNIDSKESDTRKVSQDELVKFWKAVGIEPSRVHSLKPGEQMQTTILQSRFGVELWKYCICLALILAFLEMFIARDSRIALQHATS
ncbi:MAG: BatA domain-containing protein [Ignavibacteria bacterium]|nr:BatA domain-containing protein [Ignavibacteria bacterium]MBI3765149.1 BatA domain-containing protein [Ignavibacteriales bacterium]